LRLTRIETIPLRIPLTRTYSGSAYRMTHRSTLIVRLHTESGIVGEAYVGDEDAALIEIDRIVHDEIAARVRGVDLFAIERVWQLARPTTFDILRDRRLGLVACAGIDTAAWDAIGKLLNQPPVWATEQLITAPTPDPDSKRPVLGGSEAQGGAERSGTLSERRHTLHSVSINYRRLNVLCETASTMTAVTSHCPLLSKRNTAAESSRGPRLGPVPRECFHLAA
jgi:hypothetical protein